MSRHLLLAVALLAGCSEPDCEPAWTVTSETRGGALLAAAGVAADDAWLVGGGLGDGGARVLRWDGVELRDVAIGRPETLWWTWIAPDGAVWMVGEGGLVLQDLEPLDAGTTATIYGVWGAASDDVWLVGDDQLVLRWDGAAFSRVELPASGGGALFKVWGASGDDVWITGAAGAIWRWHDGAFTDHRRATAAGVLTVHGCAADEVYAVGGARVWRWDGAAWLDEPAPGFAAAAGVACGAREVLVVGVQGARARRDRVTGAWRDDQLDPYVATDFHGAWAAPDGALWAIGGDYLAPAGGGDRRGVVARRGCR